MPRYYFNLESPHSLQDLEGQELEDVQAAKCEAIHTIARTLCSEPQAFWDADAHRVCVTGEEGENLFHVDIMTTTTPAALSAVRPRL